MIDTYSYIYNDQKINVIKTRTIMKKLKRHHLKKITGAGPAPIYCDIGGGCPPNLCCTSDNTCKDFRKYPCV